MTGFKGMIFALILTATFAILLIQGGVLMAQSNYANHSIANDDTLMNYSTSVSGQLDQAYLDANTTDSAMRNSPVTLSTGAIIYSAISGVWKTMISVPVTLWNLTATLIHNQYAGGPIIIIIGVIGTLLTLGIVLAVWKLVFTGDGG